MVAGATKEHPKIRARLLEAGEAWVKAANVSQRLHHCRSSFVSMRSASLSDDDVLMMKHAAVFGGLSWACRDNEGYFDCLKESVWEGTHLTWEGTQVKTLRFWLVYPFKEYLQKPWFKFLVSDFWGLCEDIWSGLPDFLFWAGTKRQMWNLPLDQVRRKTLVILIYSLRIPDAEMYWFGYGCSPQHFIHKHQKPDIQL